MHIIALLPMKGHSERVPNKNMKLFNGKPLYRIVLDTILKSKYINEVHINTDSVIICNDIRENYDSRVFIIDRPKDIIGDFVSMNKIIEYDLSKSEGDLYVQTHSTNPLLKAESLDKAIEKQIEFSDSKEYDSIFSVTKLQSRLYDKDCNAYNHNINELLRTQDLDPLFEENSNFYIFSKESFAASNNKRIGIRPYMFELDKIEAIDIDDKRDFIIAETLHKLKF